jgi:hypothetical protein
VATAPRGLGPCPVRSWRITWIVRLITCVRTSTGWRAASAVVGGFAGCSAIAASAPAASVATAAIARVCVLRMFKLSRSVVGATLEGLRSSPRQAFVKLWQSQAAFSADPTLSLPFPAKLTGDE